MDELPDNWLDAKVRATSLIQHTYEDDFSYMKEIEDLFHPESGSMHNRVIFNINRIKIFDKILWEQIINDPLASIPAISEAIKELLLKEDDFDKIIDNMQIQV